MFRFRKNVIISKSNSGVSLVSLLVGLGLLAIFIVMSSTIFKNFYTTKKTISEAQKALDVTGSIIYDVFDSIGTLADNLGRGNCQNLKFEDILNDIYKCDCDNILGCRCDKTDMDKRTFFIPILGMTEVFNTKSINGNVDVRVKFANIYKKLPQTETQLLANGMPEEVVKRCFNSELLNTLNENIQPMTEEEKQKIENYHIRSKYHEYFSLVVNLLQEEIRFSKIYTSVMDHIYTIAKNSNYYGSGGMLDLSDTFTSQDMSDIKDAVNKLSKYIYSIRYSSTPNGEYQIFENNTVSPSWIKGSPTTVIPQKPSLDSPSKIYPGKREFSSPSDTTTHPLSFSTEKSDFVILCDDLSSFNKCTPNKLYLSEKLNDIATRDYNPLRESLATIERIYESIASPTEAEITTLDYVKDLKNVFSKNQVIYNYLDQITRLNELNKELNDESNTKFKKYTEKHFTQDIQTYNDGKDPFIDDLDLYTLLEKERYCNKTNIHVCFNIQNNDSGSDFLSGTNPNENNLLDCYGKDVDHPKCKDRSSIILEIKAYPISIDVNEQNISFFQYNDNGSLNKLLKMIYILHWTKKIDGKYKYFKTTSSFTLATSSNLRQ